LETPEEELGQRFHISSKLLAELNPGKKLDTAGERITVPNMRHAAGRLAVREASAHAAAFCGLRVGAQEAVVEGEGG
jgi:hypothetical protein